MPGLLRVQKIIAEAGYCSRREAEELIKAHQVTLNGKLVSDLGTKADPESDHIKVNGRLIRGSEPKVVLLLNKPKGFITTEDDEKGRPTVMSLVHRVKFRVFPVGRLDFNTQGSLLLTNDGELSRRILLPKFKIPRVYLAKVQGIPGQSALDRLSKGVMIEGFKTAPARFSLKKVLKSNAWLEIVLYEGKKRQIHKMCDLIGHPVKELIRIRFAFLSSQELKEGEYRFLTSKEIAKLKGLVDL